MGLIGKMAALPIRRCDRLAPKGKVLPTVFVCLLDFQSHELMGDPLYTGLYICIYCLSNHVAILDIASISVCEIAANWSIACSYNALMSTSLSPLCGSLSSVMRNAIKHRCADVDCNALGILILFPIGVSDFVGSA